MKKDREEFLRNKNSTCNTAETEINEENEAKIGKWQKKRSVDKNSS
jgi:hypothetical protein